MYKQEPKGTNTIAT